MSQGPHQGGRAVKICGVSRPEDAALAVELGATHLGLNFWPGSPRFVDGVAAREIADAVRGRVTSVGVFVNAGQEEIEAARESAALDLLQFHGDETPEQVSAFGDRAVRALRVNEAPTTEELEAYGEIWGYLFDVHVPGSYGGTGVGWDYAALASAQIPRPYFVAGGIRPDNVRRALDSSCAYGVDVCSGVEAAPGRKDPDLLRRLFEELEGTR